MNKIQNIFCRNTKKLIAENCKFQYEIITADYNKIKVCNIIYIIISTSISHILLKLCLIIIKQKRKSTNTWEENKMFFSVFFNEYITLLIDVNNFNKIRVE